MSLTRKHFFLERMYAAADTPGPTPEFMPSIEAAKEENRDSLPELKVATNKLQADLKSRIALINDQFPKLPDGADKTALSAHKGKLEAIIQEIDQFLADLGDPQPGLLDAAFLNFNFGPRFTELQKKATDQVSAINKDLSAKIASLIPAPATTPATTETGDTQAAEKEQKKAEVEKLTKDVVKAIAEDEAIIAILPEGVTKQMITDNMQKSINHITTKAQEAVDSGKNAVDVVYGFIKQLNFGLPALDAKTDAGKKLHAEILKKYADAAALSKPAAVAAAPQESGAYDAKMTADLKALQLGQKMEPLNDAQIKTLLPILASLQAPANSGQRVNTPALDDFIRDNFKVMNTNMAELTAIRNALLKVAYEKDKTTAAQA